MTRRHVHLSLTEKLAVIEVLKQQCTKLDNEAFYQPGWDDARVASTVGGKANSRHIRTIREELFGPLGRTPPPDSTLLARVDDLERRVKALEGRLI